MTDGILEFRRNIDFVEGRGRPSHDNTRYDLLPRVAIYVSRG